MTAVAKQEYELDPATGELTAPRTVALARPIVTPAAMVEAHKEVTALITEALEAGVDYGQIPGTGDKPTLLKPGAERLARAFGAVPHYEVVARETDHDRTVEWVKRKKIWRNQFKGDRVCSWAEEAGTSLGLYRFEVRCVLQRGDGAVLGEGLGSCSTMESKYIDRPRDCENTVLKMAQKRALVAAVLNGFGLSARFTQDVEDHQQEAPPAPPPTEKAGPRAQGRGKKMADYTEAELLEARAKAEETGRTDVVEKVNEELEQRRQQEDET